MAEKLICMGCMSPLQEGDTKCARCGYPVGGINPPEYMRIRTLLNGRYLVGRVLEVSGDSVVYMGLDRQDDTPVTVREFFPTTMARRSDSAFPLVPEGHEEQFTSYKQKFLSCARAVARLRGVLVLVPYFDIFEENGTAYGISEYCEGMSLERYVRAKGPLSYEQVRQMFLPLIEALSTIHGAGVLHLGICPKNVLVDPTGRLRIKNFCIPDTHTVNTPCAPVLINGYSAPEQYRELAVCGQAADVYGVAATLCFALTAKTPVDAAVRARKGDELTLPASVADQLPAHVKESLSRALRVSATHRTQTARQLLDELTATSAVAALIDEEEPTMTQPRKKKKGNYLWLIFAGVVVALAILAVTVLNGLGIITFGDTTATTTTQGNLTMNSTTTGAPIVTKPTGSATVSAENLVGRAFETVVDTTLTGNMTVSLMGYRFSDQPTGTILEQSPAAETQVERGAVISVIISAGPAEKAMPDMTNWPEEYARLYLQALGYRVSEETLYLQSGTTVEKGHVANTTPAPGEPITAGGEIILWVSNVEQQTENPVDDPLFDQPTP